MSTQQSRYDKLADMQESGEFSMPLVKESLLYIQAIQVENKAPGLFTEFSSCCGARRAPVTARGLPRDGDRTAAYTYYKRDFIYMLFKDSMKIPDTENYSKYTVTDGKTSIDLIWREDTGV
jgi:hypothetical protein